ncbi:MAG: hypothetical protein CVV47_04610 [Spirochaetae bacterium HGW-Spirochaetae-3]|jgi:Na+-transporting methylmalonyl-CoA/oxaloacetate decarboxylase gamma subunit|nr:MAG: hypothetical protein CVV47_04610 [Spirochaetae bacterium HGW-Spirochaetae-3]
METVVATETAAQMWTIVVAGISTVFLCLLSLVVMIGIFKLIFVRAPKAGPAVASAVASTAVASPSPNGVDGSVVAAIVAAIASASGVPASSLRIASIERSGFNTPAWGHVDRA